MQLPLNVVRNTIHCQSCAYGLNDDDVYRTRMPQAALECSAESYVRDVRFSKHPMELQPGKL